jgi:hypothetical protein
MHGAKVKTYVSICSSQLSTPSQSNTIFPNILDVRNNSTSESKLRYDRHPKGNKSAVRIYLVKYKEINMKSSATLLLPLSTFTAYYTENFAIFNFTVCL